MFGHRSTAVFKSGLYDQSSFYAAFMKDLDTAKYQVIIESPFITAKRMRVLLPVFRRLARRGVRIVVNTKPPEEHEPAFVGQVAGAVAALQTLGAVVLFTTGHHRKLAVIDRKIVWEGSLNILSQHDSCEFMRRIQSQAEAEQLLAFLDIDKFMDTVQ